MAPRADGVARPGQDWPTYQPFEPDIMSLNWGPYPGRERFIEAESVVCPAQEHTRQDASARSRTTLLRWHARGQGFESLSSTSKAFFELKLRVGSTVVDPVSYLLARPPVPCFCTSAACIAVVTGQLGALDSGASAPLPVAASVQAGRPFRSLQRSGEPDGVPPGFRGPGKGNRAAQPGRRPTREQSPQHRKVSPR